MLGLFSLNFLSLPAASTSAVKFEALWQFLMVSGTATFVVVLGAAFYLVVKYRRRGPDDETPYLPHNYLIEFSSLFITSVVVAIIFIWGWRDYRYMITARLDEFEVNVIGQQWSWQIQYADGRAFTNDMYLPEGRPVKLIITAKDVLHSFFIPAFRIKKDAVPGQYSELRFLPIERGVYDIFCSQYCGTSHSGMVGKVYVLSPEDWQDWLNGTYKKPDTSSLAVNMSSSPLTMAEQGAVLYKSKSCATCHTADGSRLIGPSFKGLFGSQQELMDGSKVMADENYIRESVMDPMKKIVKGYPPAMPTFRGQLSDKETNELIAYIKTLK